MSLFVSLHHDSTVRSSIDQTPPPPRPTEYTKATRRPLLLKTRRPIQNLILKAEFTKFLSFIWMSASLDRIDLCGTAAEKPTEVSNEQQHKTRQ